MASILKEESGCWDEAMKEAEELYSDFSSDNWESGIYWTDEINYESHQTNTLVSLRSSTMYSPAVFTAIHITPVISSRRKRGGRSLWPI